MTSIKHSPVGQPIPDFRNFGVMLRILLGVNLLALAAALVQGGGAGDCLQRYIEMAAWVQPLLLLNLLGLAAAGPFLLRLPVRAAQFAVLAAAAASSLWLADLWRSLGLDDGGSGRLARAAMLGAGAAATMLFYFDLRARAFSPALTEARLQSLTARIRPHFLFNSLNAVLSLIRADPKRAETALEELAELFRVLMREPRDLLPLAEEIALCRQYLDIERLRLGERLHVAWEILDLPPDMSVPPLMLQPLIENAVYHGIEPLPDGGTISIRFAREGDRLQIDLANPCGVERVPGSGRHMALDNIRERLGLYYDLEARLETREETRPDGSREYRVRITLPCRSPSA